MREMNEKTMLINAITDVESNVKKILFSELEQRTVIFKVQAIK